MCSVLNSGLVGGMCSFYRVLLRDAFDINSCMGYINRINPHFKTIRTPGFIIHIVAKAAYPPTVDAHIVLRMLFARPVIPGDCCLPCAEYFSK